MVPPLPSVAPRDFFANRATRKELQGAFARLLDWCARMFGLVDPADLVVPKSHAGRVWADYRDRASSFSERCALAEEFGR